jgi:hypothetical protein
MLGLFEPSGKRLSTSALLPLHRRKHWPTIVTDSQLGNMTQSLLTEMLQVNNKT